MISVVKLVRAERTLADLVHEFESLAEKYHRAEEALKADQSLDVHRRDVDSMCSISAGMCLLVAVERGFIRSVDSAVWNLFDARTNRINNHIRVYSRLQDQWKELADPSSPRLEPLGYGDYLSADGIAAYYSATESPIPAEPIDLDALRRKAESHLQEITQLKAKLELDSDLDLTSDEGQSLLMWTWTAFVRLELVPNHVSEFKPDWQQRLMPPDFFAVYGVKDSGQRNQARSLFEKVPGETKEDRHRYCVIARANIYATACRVIVKLLYAEIDRLLAMIGRPQTSVQGGKVDESETYSFKDQGEFVRICGFDEDVTVEKSAGVERLIAVVTAPTRRMLVMELVRIGVAQPADERNLIDRDSDGLTERESVNDERFGSALGDDALQAARDAVGDMMAERDAAADAGDDDKAERLTKQINASLDSLKPDLQKAAAVVRKSLDRTYDRLRKDGKGKLLAAHFDKRVIRRRGSPDYVYEPDKSERKIVWKVK